MDPEQCWNDLSQAIANHDWNRAGELAEALFGWISRGGFSPTITGHTAFDLIIVRSTCDAIMAWDV